MGKKVYIVTFDGFFDSYVDKLYLLGIYESEEDANLAIKKVIEETSDPVIRRKLSIVLDNAHIHPAIIGETLPMKAIKRNPFMTDVYTNVGLEA